MVSIMRALSDLQLSVSPGRVFDEMPADCLDGWGDLVDARRPFFRVGDVIAYEGPHGLRRAIIVAVSREHNPRTGDWIQKYKVRLYNGDGEMGRAWRWTYPGFIERALAKVTGEWA